MFLNFNLYWKHHKLQKTPQNLQILTNLKFQKLVKIDKIVFYIRLIKHIVALVLRETIRLIKFE